jgi:hypothetical protein
VSALLFLAITETAIYCTHRALHTRRLYKALHVYHHKFRVPTPWGVPFAPWISLLVTVGGSGWKRSLYAPIEMLPPDDVAAAVAELEAVAGMSVRRWWSIDGGTGMAAMCAGGGMYAESVAATIIGVAALTILRRFEDKDDRIRRRLMLTLTDAAVATEALVTKLANLDLLPTIEGWNKENAGSLRQLTLGLRLPRIGGESTLIAALESEPGISRMQLDPVT